MATTLLAVRLKFAQAGSPRLLLKFELVSDEPLSTRFFVNAQKPSRGPTSSYYFRRNLHHADVDAQPPSVVLAVFCLFIEVYHPSALLLSQGSFRRVARPGQGRLVSTMATITSRHRLGHKSNQKNTFLPTRGSSCQSDSSSVSQVIFCVVPMVLAPAIRSSWSPPSLLLLVSLRSGLFCVLLEETSGWPEDMMLRETAGGGAGAKNVGGGIRIERAPF
ncbi:hypothetical protein OF83DRAFT_1143717 [Amylostereum chailletii]|nr:hypothetical protein OF83DRAFT_1143717 [Amylostereum chailletii]